MAKLINLNCPSCGNMICKIEVGAMGAIHEKCRVCKREWRIDLLTNKIDFIRGRPTLHAFPP